MGLILALIFALVVAGLITRFTRLIPPDQSPCHGDCNQGRNCTCGPTLAEQRKHQLDDEFNNDNWPFPVGKKP